MGWDGISLDMAGKTNKELLMESYSRISSGVESGEFKISQKGSDVYLLFKANNPSSEVFGKYWVMCYLCRREDGMFLTKSLDAIREECFDFPKNWLKYLDSSNKEIADYLEKRKDYESKLKLKSKKSFAIGDVVRCVSKYAITWNNGKTIQNGQEFFIKVCVHNPYAKRQTKDYVITTKNGDNWQNHFLRISPKTFQNLEVAELVEKAK